MGDTYRQITHRLRIQRGPGRTDKISERPRNLMTGDFLDDASNPTLITFDEYDQVNIPYLLTLGAIEPWKPEVKRGKAK